VNRLYFGDNLEWLRYLLARRVTQTIEQDDLGRIDFLPGWDGRRFNSCRARQPGDFSILVTFIGRIQSDLVGSNAV
jgi:hypothetical protein